MKTKFLITAALFIALGAAGAPRIGYAYDQAGNRVKRELVIPRQAAPRATEYTDPLGDRTVRFSVETDGVVTVSVEGLVDEDECLIDLFSFTGELLESTRPRTESTDIDLSGHPAGIYVLKVTVNGNATSWKINKL